MSRAATASSVLARGEGLTLVRHGYAVVRDMSFDVPYGVIGAVWAPPTTAATLFEALAGERAPVKGALSVVHAVRVGERSGLWSPTMTALEYAQLVALSMDTERRKGLAPCVREEVRLLGLPTWQPLGTMHCWAPLLCRIAAALATNPRLLLLDIPTLLESAHAARIVSRLLSHASQRQMTALMAVSALSQVPSATRWIAHSSDGRRWVSAGLGEGSGQLRAFEVARTSTTATVSPFRMCVAHTHLRPGVEQWLVHHATAFREWSSQSGVVINREHAPDAVDVFSMLNRA